MEHARVPAPESWRVRRRMSRAATVIVVLLTAQFIFFAVLGPLLPRLGLQPRWGWLLPLAAALLLADRGLLAAERHGLVYWRHHSASTSALGTALLGLQAILEPDKHHVVEERVRGDADEDADGDPPRDA
jgi:hypothetical protein